ncbi:hypothetical protein, partial [Oscillatoria sp. HE19RPO]|uniref:hypothetical protein n=1 Tax=Oscillatoria sp. HE19RPO TaxID=2954806 RepID=UPI0020C4EC18
MFFITYLRHPFNYPINNSAVSFCYTTGDQAGFTPDDTENSPHRQALAWYAGTTNLSGSELPLLEGAREGEKIYRR